LRWADFRLRIGCSTTELPRPLIIKDLRLPVKQSENFALFLRCSLPEFRRFVASILIREGVASSEPLSPITRTASSFLHILLTPLAFLPQTRQNDNAPKGDTNLILDSAHFVRKRLSLEVLRRPCRFKLQRPEGRRRKMAIPRGQITSLDMYTNFFVICRRPRVELFSSTRRKIPSK
jgi:hypothetical protein